MSLIPIIVYRIRVIVAELDVLSVPEQSLWRAVDFVIVSNVRVASTNLFIVCEKKSQPAFVVALREP